jgi:hypothetical protein
MPSFFSMTPNDLRRTFGSWLKQAGVDSFTVASMMRHSSSVMVEKVYGQLNNAAFITASKLLPPMLPVPEAGSKWVADESGLPETSETPETSPTAQPPETKQPSVPKAGIEPATRG